MVLARTRLPMSLTALARTGYNSLPSFFSDSLPLRSLRRRSGGGGTVVATTPAAPATPRRAHGHCGAAGAAGTASTAQKSALTWERRQRRDYLRGRPLNDERRPLYQHRQSERPYTDTAGTERHHLLLRRLGDDLCRRQPEFLAGFCDDEQCTRTPPAAPAGSRRSRGHHASCPHVECRQRRDFLCGRPLNDERRPLYQHRQPEPAQATRMPR